MDPDSIDDPDGVEADWEAETRCCKRRRQEGVSRNGLNGIEEHDDHSSDKDNVQQPTCRQS